METRLNLWTLVIVGTAQKQVREADPSAHQKKKNIIDLVVDYDDIVPITASNLKVITYKTLVAPKTFLASG